MQVKFPIHYFQKVANVVWLCEYLYCLNSLRDVVYDQGMLIGTHLIQWDMSLHSLSLSITVFLFAGYWKFCLRQYKRWRNFSAFFFLHFLPAFWSNTAENLVTISVRDSCMEQLMEVSTHPWVILKVWII